MPDPVPAVPPVAVVAATKSGFLTSEFWLAAVSALALALTSILSGLPALLGKINPILGVVAAAIIPAAIAWISSHYTKGRSDVKVATLAATASPQTIVTTLSK